MGITVNSVNSVSRSYRNIMFGAAALVGALVAGLVVFPGAVQAAPVDDLIQVVIAAEDTYAAGNAPNTPQNAPQDELWVVGTSAAENSIHMKFMVPVAPPGTELVSATLGMTTIAGNDLTNNSSNRARITQTSSDWSADTLTYNNRPARGPVHLTGVHVNGASFFYAYPLNLALVKAHGPGMMGLGMFRDTVATKFYAFHSKEAIVDDTAKPHIKFVFKDIEAPTVPSNLAATVAAKNVNLVWSASTDNIGVAGYRVYRGTTAGFTPAAGNLRTTTGPTVTTFTDPARPDGTYFYKVVAFDAAQNASAPSAHAKAVIAEPAAITVTKLWNGAPAPAGSNLHHFIAGTSVDWTYEVKNTGGYTLTDVSVVDDNGHTVVCPSTTLSPAATMTCTGTGVVGAGLFGVTP